MRSIATALAFLWLTAPSFASCDVNDAYADKQAACASACEDQFIRDRQHPDTSVNAKAGDARKACETKCGCSESAK